MDKHEFQCRAWRVLYKFLLPFIRLKFNIKHDIFDMDGPCIVVCNHVSSWDPLMLACSFPNTKLYYIASEHLFRKGLISKLIVSLLAPIPRRKSTTATDTVRATLRHLKEGHSICIYPEGAASWDGLPCELYSSTGKLVRSARVPLVTYRLEGGYLSAPRWGKGTRRGLVRCHKVGVYQPEELRSMTVEEINQLVIRDIGENAWERQKIENIAFKSRKPARYMERCLFLCPKCKKVGGLKGEGDMFRCSCGFETRFMPNGLFEPPLPFGNIAQWDAWQHEALRSGDFEHGAELFSDDGVVLRELGMNHEQRELASGRIYATNESLNIGEYSFKYADISALTLVQASKMPFSHGEKYYEIHAKKPRCLRKYAAVWENNKN